MVSIAHEGDLYIVRAGTFIVARCKSISTAFAWADHYNREYYREGERE